MIECISVREILATRGIFIKHTKLNDCTLIRKSDFTLKYFSHFQFVFHQMIDSLSILKCEAPNSKSPIK